MSTQNQASNARTIELTLADGDPTGVIIAELGNWAGKVVVVVVSRTNLPKLLERDEATRTGVYLLIGDDPENLSRPMVYVGQSEHVGRRLMQHDSDERKDFFRRIFCIVDKEDGLNSAHVEYLEKKVIRAIDEAGRANLDNKNRSPISEGILKEGQEGDMNRFFEELEVLLPALNLDVLRKVMEGSEGNVRFLLKRGDACARAEEVSGEFIVLKDSRAGTDKPSISESIKSRRHDLIQGGVLKKATDGQGYIFTDDHPFDTPSGAGSIVCGCNVRGPIEWKLMHNDEPTQTTYKVWRERELQRRERQDSA